MKTILMIVMGFLVVSCGQPYNEDIQKQEEQVAPLDQRDHHPSAEDTEELRDRIGIHGVQH